MNKLTYAWMAGTVVLGIGAAGIQPAEAHRRGGDVAAGVAAGIVTLGILGAYAQARDRGACYKGPRRCEQVDRTCWYNRYGDYVCRGGEWRCWRPTICD